MRVMFTTIIYFARRPFFLPGTRFGRMRDTQAQFATFRILDEFASFLRRFSEKGSTFSCEV